MLLNIMGDRHCGDGGDRHGDRHGDRNGDHDGDRDCEAAEAVSPSPPHTHTLAVASLCMSEREHLTGGHADEVPGR